MKYAIYGTGGFAREVLPYLERSAQDTEATNGLIDAVFVDDDPAMAGTRLKDRDVLSFEQLCASEHTNRKVIIAIGDGKIRRAIVDKCSAHNIAIANLVDKSATLFSPLPEDGGVLLCPYTTICADVKIGTQFHANLYSYVGHDCIIGDYVTFAPRVSCNGNIHISDNVYVGTGAVFKQGTPDEPLTVGENSIVGMGAVVLESVPANCTVFGNPARVISKHKS